MDRLLVATMTGHGLAGNRARKHADEAPTAVDREA
jgi:hypothetical protein